MQNRKNYVLSGTAIAITLGAIALLRDIFDFRLTTAEILRLVQDPIVYWLFCICLFFTGILIGYKALPKRKNSEKIRVFDLSNAQDFHLFYEELYKSYREARSEIY